MRSASDPQRLSTRRFFLLVLLGVLLIQAAWVLVVPPFRGLDEHDHAYKAAAVARGDWSPHHEEGPTRGQYMAVPRELVEAARPVCESLEYTGPDNCTPGPATDDGLVLVATAAAQYNPVFYFLSGTAARVLDGTGALYIMRAAGALGSAVLIALAAVALRRWARTRWPAVAFLLTAAPTMLYTTSVAAPNGVEVSAAMLVWCALLGLVASDKDRSWFVVMATVGAVPLVTVRSVGPLWLLLTVAAIVPLLGGRRLRDLLRSRAALACIGVVGTVTVGAAAWSLAASTNIPPAPEPESLNQLSVWSALPNETVLWVLQNVGAFPSRDNAAPPIVYAMVLGAWLALTVVALRAARRRERLTLAAVVLVSALVPIAATVATYDTFGTSWQGRYGYPFTMGFLLICGLVLDRARADAPRWLVWGAAALITTAQAIGQLGVLADEKVRSPLSGTDAWLTPSPLLVVGLQVAACVALGYALSGRPVRTAAPSEPAVDSLPR